MVFVDNLGLELVTLPIVGFLIIHIFARAYMAGRKGNYNAIREVLKEGSVSLGFIGAFISILSFWGEITWTLPSGYNILFNDTYLLMGLLLIVFSASVLMNKGATTSGFLSLLSGLFTIYYGVNGYMLGMTREPLALLLIYAFWGLAGIAALPATRVLDALTSSARTFEQQIPTRTGTVVPASVQMPREPSRTSAGGWLVRHPLLVMSVFWIFLALAALISMYVALNTIPAHLAQPP